MNGLPVKTAIVTTGLVLAGATAFYLLAPSASQSSASGLFKPADTGIVSAGAEIYAAQCAQCHGSNLEGQENWQTRGTDGLMPAPPHDETGHTWHHPDAALFAMTKYGIGAAIGNPDYASAMPAYEGVLNDAQIIAVLSYIKSTWPDEIRMRHDQMNAAFERSQQGG